ncbi:MAG: exosortase/archaeosortase family protein [Pirellulales bacterium]|nr:exosortase/archaeosortase family protein [Pirellulales bacterium]
MTTLSATANRPFPLDRRGLLFLVLAGVVTVYANILAVIQNDFWSRPEYSHGYLIPMFACILLWFRRPEPSEVSDFENKLGWTLIGVGVVVALLLTFVPEITEYYPEKLDRLMSLSIVSILLVLAGSIVVSGPVPLREVNAAERWWGFLILAVSLGLRLLATQFAMRIPEMVSIVPALLGGVVLVGGWQALRWAWPALLILLFMFPLPDFVERELLNRMQHWACIASTVCLQTLGLAVYREGNRIVMGEMRLGVVDQCAGLRSATILFALTVALVLLLEPPIWMSVAIIFSGLPVAFAVNVTRITVTGLLYQVDPKMGETVHDMAGLVMIPLALGILYCEWQILTHLVLEDEDLPPELIDTAQPARSAV